MNSTASYVGVGYLFHPTDDQLVDYFIHKKATGEFQTIPACYNNHVFEFDLYEKEPWILWDRFGGPKRQHGEDLYFFTKLHKVSPNGSRVVRKVGSGTWSGDNSEVVYGKGSQNPIGLKRNFHYENPGSDDHGCWLMHEYSKPDVKDFVLCRLRKNDRYEKKIKKQNKRKLTSNDGQESTKKKKLRKSANTSYVEDHEEQGSGICEKTLMNDDDQLHVDQSISNISEDDYFQSDEFKRLLEDDNFLVDVDENVGEQALVHVDHQLHDRMINNISVNDYDISSACLYFEPDEFKRLLEDDNLVHISVDADDLPFGSAYFGSDEFKKLVDNNLVASSSSSSTQSDLSSTPLLMDQCNSSYFDA